VSQVGSGGPGMLWKLYKATPVSAAKKAVMAEVCVWLLDKKELADERAKRGTRYAGGHSTPGCTWLSLQAIPP